MLRDMTTPPDPQFRPPHPDDADALLALRQACAAADGHDPFSASDQLPTRDELADQLRAAAPERYPLLTFQNQVIAYGRIADWTEADGTRVWLHCGWVSPAWLGKGVGTTLLRELESRIRRLAAAGGDGRWEFAANASSTEPEATRLLLDHGYHVAYTVIELRLDWSAFEALPGRSFWPAGFTTRSATPDDTPAIARSIDAAYRHEYAGDRYREVMDVAAYAAELCGAPYDLSLLQVAWAGDEVAGQVIPLIEHGWAEIYEVSVPPAYRRRGLARALLTRALAELRRRGMAEVRIGTVLEFPTQAVALYRSLGFQPVKTFPRYRKPTDVA